MPKITKRLIDSLAPSSGRDQFVWDAGDGALKGFGLRIKPSGAAAFIVQYRNKEGRTRRLVLGRTGVLTPDAARKLAAKKLQEVAKGGDPSADRHALRASTTVAELCDLYLADAKPRIKASTWVNDRSRIDAHVKPLIGRLTVQSITSADIERMKAEIIAGRTAKPRRASGRGGVVTGGRGVAGRTLGMLGGVFELGRTLKLRPDNPVREVRKPPDQKRTRFLSRDEIARLGKVMRECEKSGESATALAAIRLLLLTGLRRVEGLGLRHEWVDSRGRCIRFPDTKTGPQLRPIGNAAVRLIEARQPKNPDSTWVFPAARGVGHWVGLPKALARVCRRAGLKRVSAHVLRHTFASVAAEMGFSELTIAGLLGHRLHGITVRYSHLPDAALISAADRVAAEIAATLDDVSVPENVVPMPRKLA